MNLILILQGMDMIFTRLIFLPALIILYFKFRPRRPWTIRTRRLYYLCLILVGLYLLRLFCAGFIFTPVNYPRFTIHVNSSPAFLQYTYKKRKKLLFQMFSTF